MFFMKENGEKSKFSFIEGLTYPLVTVNNNIMNFFAITCFFSLVTTIICFFLGRSFLCGILLSADMDIGVFCSLNNFNVILSMLINLIGVSFYINRIGFISEKQDKRYWFLKKIGWKKELKAFFIVCLYLLLWGIIGGMGYILKFRMPTPDWKFELSLFVVYSLFIILACFFLLGFVGFVHYLRGGRFFEIKKVFWPVFDEIFKLIFWFFIYFLIFAFLFASVFRYFVAHMNVWNVFLSEFCIYFILYFMVAIIYFSFEYQEKALFREE